MKRTYPIGIQDFQELRNGGYLYIDKTQQVDDLIRSGKYYFLSRPRRFGKSLLLSTLKYIFLGKKELFEGLWIENRKDWNPHPVMHISFSSIGYKELGLLGALTQVVDIFAKKHGFALSGKGLAVRFRELIELLGSGKQKLVILIDEYDKPLVDYITEIGKAKENREILKNFFSVIKDSDPYLRFFFITGVSKFSKVSLFSDLNHLEDLTTSPVSAELTGYTQHEIDTYFQEEIQELALSQEVSFSEIREQIKSWYNGYLWAGKERLYNPFSMLNFAKQKVFKNFWWETGTPTFLIKKLRSEFQFELESLDAGAELFESYTLEDLDFKSLLFQTGYLTIHNYDPDVSLYTLGFPNREVKDSMYRHLLGAFRETAKSESQPLLAYIKRALDAHDLDRLIELIDTLFSTIPFPIFLEKQEAFFHAILHLTFSGVGLMTQSEVHTSKGRVDTVVHTPKFVFIMEFKLDAPVSAAMAQIREKRYGSPFLNQNKKVIALGISFSSKTKTVEEWESMAYEELLAEG